VSALAIGLIVFVLVFGSALLAMLVRKALPEHHLSADSKDTVKLGIALIATMSALVLSLLVASAKSAFDTSWFRPPPTLFCSIGRWPAMGRRRRSRGPRSGVP
jgi:hypothetical protein